MPDQEDHSRAKRRDDMQRLKTRAKKILPPDMDERRVGKFVSTHGRACSCDLCKRGESHKAKQRFKTSFDEE